VGFVALAPGDAGVATKPSSGVGFVALAARGATVATKPTLAKAHFVALAQVVPRIATFVPV
jgi:hypothetical protein